MIFIPTDVSQSTITNITDDKRRLELKFHQLQ